MKIHVLEKAVAERIAAGEVVERPASVVKELVENAIDAGATAIAVEIREGGSALIRVGDNGCGMTQDDAARAVERFATSKLERAQDLDAITTLGFRGEALPSIASVSHLEILTRPRDGSEAPVVEGTRVRTVDGQVEMSVAGAPMGTQVTVQRLFYNAPARAKFLKAPLRETELVQKTLMPYALAYPQVAFRLIVDGRESLIAPAATPLERIGAMWRREVAGEMLELSYSSVDLQVSGFVSRPTFVRSSRDWQVFIVNGRPIRSGLLAITLERAYAGRIPPNRHPLALIQVQIAPNLVDVNVHPRKAEVRLYQERAIYGAVAQAVEEALRDVPAFSASPSIWQFADLAVQSANTGEPVLREAPEHYVSPVTGWRAVAQIHNTFILAQSAEGLVIIDQHAAQEQVYYELMTTAAGGEPRSVDVQIPSTAHESRLVFQHLLEYRSLGIECEEFGENTVRVTALPSFVGLEARDFVTAVLDEHARNKLLVGDALRDKLAARAACISAVKAGDALDTDAQQALLDQLAQAFAPATCPHGRPVFVTLRLVDLERRFLRR